MGLWFPFASMTVAAIIAVLWPLARSRAAPTAGNDLAVYRDQMRELARERADGLIAPAEADAARAEVGRRLIAAAAAAERAAPPAATPWRRGLAAVAAGLALPGTAVGLYLALGAPDLPDRPLAAHANGPPQTRALAGDRPEVRRDGATRVGIGERP
ncbi:MAG TPA: c-type cytochrome biogenesis protein CcmI [Xanthobacteraceae bacterium]|nr:c-type cytochrome biogenesis protein CcmI [Xanthobacteraceae bacterium]